MKIFDYKYAFKLESFKHDYGARGADDGYIEQGFTLNNANALLNTIRINEYPKSIDVNYNGNVIKTIWLNSKDYMSKCSFDTYCDNILNEMRDIVAKHETRRL